MIAGSDSPKGRVSFCHISQPLAPKLSILVGWSDATVCRENHCSISPVYPSEKFLCLRTNVVLTVPHTQSPFHHHVCGWFPHDPQDSPLLPVGYHLSWGMGIMPPLGLTWYMVMRKELNIYTYIIIPLVKGSLARKLPSYGRLSWSALASPSSCQPHHHVN